MNIIYPSLGVTLMKRVDYDAFGGAFCYLWAGGYLLTVVLVADVVSHMD